MQHSRVYTAYLNAQTNPKSSMQSRWCVVMIDTRQKDDDQRYSSSHTISPVPRLLLVVFLLVVLETLASVFGTIPYFCKIINIKEYVYRTFTGYRMRVVERIMRKRSGCPQRTSAHLSVRLHVSGKKWITCLEHRLHIGLSSTRRSPSVKTATAKSSSPCQSGSPTD